MSYWAKVKQAIEIFKKCEKKNEGETVRYTPDFSKPLPPIDWEKFDSLTEEELQAMIDADPDDNPLTEEDWENGKTDEEWRKNQ